MARRQSTSFGGLPTLKEVCDLVISRAQHLLLSLVLDRRCEVKVLSCRTFRRLSVTHGNDYIAVVVTVQTNNARCVWGNWGPLSKRGPQGYNSYYFSAFYDGLIEAVFGRDAADTYAVRLDVLEKDFTVLDFPRFVEIQEAVRQGYISEDSPVWSAMHKYQLSHVAICGPAVIGPSPDTIRVLEWLYRRHKLRRVLDVFAGTGALSKVALRLGARSVTMVDVGGPPPLSLTTSEARRIRFVQQDVLNLRLTDDYDLAILDPFCDDVLEFSGNLASNLSRRAKYIVFHLGWADRRALITEAVMQLGIHYRQLQMFQINDSIIYIGESLCL